MELTKEQDESFARFGCSVEFPDRCVYVDFRNVHLQHIVEARTLVRAAYTRWSTTPLFCLAFENSPNRTLSRYCYYPFDLTNSLHTDFLVATADAGHIRFTFVGADGDISRRRKLKAWQIRQIKQICDDCGRDLRSRPTYDFPKALAEFESTIRVPQLFERAASDDDIPRIVAFTKKAADAVPAERRALAREVCQKFVHLWKVHFGENVTDEQFKLLYTFRAVLLLFMEFHREFGNYDELAEFLADALVTKTEDDRILRKAMEWSPRVDVALEFLNRFSPAFEADRNRIRSDFFETLADTLGDAARGRELSLTMLRGLFTPFQSILSSRPGRPSKDYSREFEWKHTHSWTEVTRKSLQENPEIREEFAGRDFDSLNFEQQEALKGRIREGVKSWAQRNGKQMPIATDRAPC